MKIKVQVYETTIFFLQTKSKITPVYDNECGQTTMGHENINTTVILKVIKFNS